MFLLPSVTPREYALSSPDGTIGTGAAPTSGTPTMPTTEPTINVAIAEALRHTRRAWLGAGVLKSENTGQLKGNNKRPDILILESNVSPVAIETEVHPAVTVEADATSRLGSDPVRREMDEAFCGDVLGMDKTFFAQGGPLDLLRQKLAHEPSIHRSKKSKVGAQVEG